MATVYRCTHCHISVHPDERQRHLHWHYITDKKLDEHFVAEEQDDAPAVETSGSSPVAPSSGTSAKAYVIIAIVVIAVVALIAAVLMNRAS